MSLNEWLVSGVLPPRKYAGYSGDLHRLSNTLFTNIVKITMGVAYFVLLRLSIIVDLDLPLAVVYILIVSVSPLWMSSVCGY